MKILIPCHAFSYAKEMGGHRLCKGLVSMARLKDLTTWSIIDVHKTPTMSEGEEYRKYWIEDRPVRFWRKVSVQVSRFLWSSHLVAPKWQELMEQYKFHRQSCSLSLLTLRLKCRHLVVWCLQPFVCSRIQSTWRLGFWFRYPGQLTSSLWWRQDFILLWVGVIGSPKTLQTRNMW